MTGIKALARHLDLSIGTVSRALNAKPDVSEATRARVLQAAHELGYRPNHSGRSLRNGRTSTIGLVLETGNASSLSGDNFFVYLVDEMKATLDALGYDLILLPCHSADDPTTFLERLIRRGLVDAVVITATRPQDARIALLVESGTPFLALGRSETPGDYAWIDLDFEGVARVGVAELVRLGHRRIAVAAPRRNVNLANVYLDAYRAAVTEAGLEVDESLIFRVSTSENGGLEVGDRILGMRDRPTAVLLNHELMAIGLYSCLQRDGLTPGRDLSIIGFRQNPQTGFLQPSLACFALDVRAVGRAVGEIAVKLTETGMGVRRIWQMDYVPGESVQKPPT